MKTPVIMYHTIRCQVTQYNNVHSKCNHIIISQQLEVLYTQLQVT